MSPAIDTNIATLPDKSSNPPATEESPEGQDSSCPSRRQLKQLVTGRADENDAERLLQHLESCVDCQSVVDRLEKKSSRLAAAAQLRKDQQADQERVDRLIRKAQNLGRSEKPASSDSATVDVDSFVSGLKRCGLFPEDEVDSLISDLDLDDSSSFARELVSRQKLTPFQARVLLKGRWKGLVLGNYVILEKLGQGGMGSVFKARHQRLGRIVCVKVINSAGRKSPRVMERFRNEARTIAALSHPNFVVAHDADEAEGVPFLVMEYIEGRDLSRQVAVEGPLPAEVGLRLMQQAAEALQYAHDSGVIHRDIKPHNLVLSTSDSEEASVKILDMGLARFDNVLNEESDDEQQCAMTNTGVIMGTVDYMAPEQALRSRDADNRSDIYSLGCTMHFLLTGGAVFGGDTMMARLVAHREAPLPSLEKRMVQPIAGLDHVFHKMLAKDPDDRYQSMQDVANDLRAVLNGEPTAAGNQSSNTATPSTAISQDISDPEPTPVLQRVRPRRAAGRTVWLATLAVFVAFILGVLVSGELGKYRLQPNKTAALSFGADVPADVPRALIVLPSDGYDRSEVSAWEEAAMKSRVAVGFVSGYQGEIDASDGTDWKPRVASISDVQPHHFDILIVSGGEHLPAFVNNHHQTLKQLIELAQQDGKAVLSGSGTAFHELNRHWSLYKQESDESEGNVHVSPSTHFVWTKSQDRIAAALDKAATLTGIRGK